jgi:hypothetical protein
MRPVGRMPLNTLALFPSAPAVNLAPLRDLCAFFSAFSVLILSVEILRFAQDDNTEQD